MHLSVLVYIILQNQKYIFLFVPLILVNLHLLQSIIYQDLFDNSHALIYDAFFLSFAKVFRYEILKIPLLIYKLPLPQFARYIQWHVDEEYH